MKQAVNTLNLPCLENCRHLEKIEGPGNEFTINRNSCKQFAKACGDSTVENALNCKFGGREFESC